jgi:hypothetical protein
VIKMNNSEQLVTPDEWREAADYAIKLSERVEKAAPLKDAETPNEGPPTQSK